MRKICVITGTRAEYGLLSHLMRLIDKSVDCQLQIIATNMHLLPEYGSTYKEIERDGFTIDVKVLMKKISDDAYGVIDSMADEMRGMNEALCRLLPDMVVILGDRYEMLVAATVAMIQHIPVTHLYGGSLTEGAIDDSIRHCITKLSSLHFTSTEEFRRRVIQLGEHPNRVFHVGSIGIENLKHVPLMSRKELEASLDFKFDEHTVVATYHPVTRGNRSPHEEIEDFLAAIDAFPNLRVLFTMPNSDQGGDIIKQSIEHYCALHADRCKSFTSLGMRRYLSALQHVSAVIGNSSSGLVEVPSAHIPTLNIGDRQKMRTHGLSVLDCGSDYCAIVAGLNTVFSPTFRQLARTAANPYEKADTAQSIFDVIHAYPLEQLNQKSFYNL